VLTTRELARRPVVAVERRRAAGATTRLLGARARRVVAGEAEARKQAGAADITAAILWCASR